MNGVNFVRHSRFVVVIKACTRSDSIIRGVHEVVSNENLVVNASGELGELHE